MDVIGTAYKAKIMTAVKRDEIRWNTATEVVDAWVGNQLFNER